MVLKAFNVDGHICKAPSIRQVDWYPPLCGRTKCNTDFVARGSSGLSAAWGIFHDYRGAVLGCFSSFMGVSYAIHVELSAIMIAIETAYERIWLNLWLECDSQLALMAFDSIYIVPWSLRNRWKNCPWLAKKMHLRVSHIFKEGNSCVDRLASFSIDHHDHDFFWWDFIPNFIKEDFFGNRLGLPSFRFR